MGDERRGRRGTYAELPVGVLESRGVSLPEIGLGPHSSSDELLLDPERLVLHLVLDLLGRVLVDTSGDDDDLELGDARGKDESLVVSVDHDHDSDTPRRESPTVLPHVELLSGRTTGVLDGDVEHLGEVLSEAVRRSTLDSSSGGRDESLDGRRVESSGELLLLRLDSRDDRDGEELFVDALVEGEDLEDLRVGLLGGEERGVALLPEELSGSEEGL